MKSSWSWVRSLVRGVRSPWAPRAAGNRGPARPRLEGLEERVQPSVLTAADSPPPAVPLAAPVAAAAPRLVAAPPAVALQARFGGSGAAPLASLNSATYVTGAAGASSALATATDPVSGDVVVTGTYDPGDGTLPVAYVAKYTGGVLDAAHLAYLQTFVFPGATGPTVGRGVAVDAAENLFAVGTSQLPALGGSGDDNVAFALKLDPTATSLLGGFATDNGPGLEASPISLNAVGLDRAGDPVAVGSFSYTATRTITLVSRSDSAFRHTNLVGFVLGAADDSSALLGVGVNTQAGSDGSQALATGSFTPTGGVAQPLWFFFDPANLLGDPYRYALRFGPTTVASQATAAAFDASGNAHSTATIDATAFSPPGAPGTTAGEVRKWSAPPAPTGGWGPVAPAVLEGAVYLDGTGATSYALNAVAVGAGGTLALAGSVTDVAGGAGSSVLVASLLDTGAGYLDNGAYGLGGTGGGDVGYGVTFDAAGNAVVVGVTNSPDFPVSDTSTLNGPQDGFGLNFTF